MDEIAAFRVRFPAEVVEEFLRRAAAVLETGQLIPGTNNAEFEDRFATLIGAGHAVTVSSGTAALEIALRVAGVEGRPVLVPANTNYATAEAVLRAGCRPVLYDAGRYPDLAAIGAGWTPEIAAVVVVHIDGYLTKEVAVSRWLASIGFRWWNWHPVSTSRWSLRSGRLRSGGSFHPTGPARRRRSAQRSGGSMTSPRHRTCSCRHSTRSYCGARKSGFGYAACVYSLISPPRISVAVRQSIHPAGHPAGPQLPCGCSPGG
jgi:hypothetical protein